MAIFLKTVPDTARGGTVPRARVMTGQFDFTGEPCNTSYNVQCDKDAREEYPVGCIFMVEAVTLIKRSTPFYSASPESLVIIANSDMIWRGANEEDYRKYLNYLSKEYPDVYLRNIIEKPLPPILKFTSVEPSVPGKPERKIKKVALKIPRRVYTLYGRICNDDKFKLPTIEDDGFYMKEETWHFMCANSEKRRNTLLLGPTGSGKTEGLFLLGKRLGKKMNLHEMGGIVDPQSALLGTHRLKEGSSIFDYAPFAKDVLKDEDIILNELSRAPREANNILFPCLDRQRELPIGIADGDHDRVLPISERCNFWGTANIGSQYSGTNMIDRALMDRFFIIEMEYMDAENEAKVLRHRTRCEVEQADTISVVASEIRELYFDQKLSDVTSHRHTLLAGELCRDGFNVRQAMSAVFNPLFEGTGTQGERSTVTAIINKYVN